MKDKFTIKERCLHYINFHARAYGAPADNETLEAIMEMTPDQVKELLSELELDGKIKYSQGIFFEGWALDPVYLKTYIDRGIK